MAHIPITDRPTEALELDEPRSFTLGLSASLGFAPAFRAQRPFLLSQASG